MAHCALRWVWERRGKYPALWAAAQPRIASEAASGIAHQRHAFDLRI